MTATKKTVLITGSTRGIGLAFAEFYVNAGWNVIGTARANSNTDKLAALSPFKIITLDAGDEATVLEAARQLEGVPIDLLINNAGIGLYSSFETVAKDAIMKSIEVNAVGPFLVTRAFVLNLKLAAKAESPATVLQISSILGSIASNKDEYAQLFRGQYGYTTSKAALNMITRSLAMDLRESNVTIVTINPGHEQPPRSDPTRRLGQGHGRHGGQALAGGLRQVLERRPRDPFDGAPVVSKDTKFQLQENPPDNTVSCS